MLARILRNTDGGEGGGQGEGDGGKVADKGPDLAKAVEGLIARHGDGTAALRVLLGENHDYRNQIRDLRKTLPPEGAVVLQGDDARAWQQYSGLGKPGELKKSLEERDQFRTEAEGFRRSELLTRAAEVTKFRPAVLKLAVRGEVIEVDDVKGKDGKAVPVAFVKGEGDTRTPLNEYAEAHWKDILPSLRAEESRPIGTPRIGTPQQTGRPPQGGNGQDRGKRKPMSSF